MKITQKRLIEIIKEEIEAAGSPSLEEEVVEEEVFSIDEEIDENY
jgi:hypothetical protein